MATKVTGEQYYGLDGQLLEINRQLRQPNGYPFNPEDLKKHLQAAIIGQFGVKSILITKPFNPAEFLGKGWKIWQGPPDGDGLSGEEDVDPRSLTFSQIEINNFLFESCSQEGESSITGEEKLRRLKAKLEFIRFDANVFLGLWLDYQVNKKNSVLEKLYQERKIVCFHFFGTILRDPHGSRGVLYLCRDAGGGWNWYCRWLDRYWSADDLSVGCAS